MMWASCVPVLQSGAKPDRAGNVELASEICRDLVDPTETLRAAGWASG